ncbi:MAG: metallopeptidase family protein [Bryobacterales bacterium]|nr:metallopeptidase family protein [Bryobacterales bacterium]
MSPKDFDSLVDAAIARIPARFRRRLRNLVFVVEPEPPQPGLLGLYEGRPLIHRSVAEPVAMPDRITIYQGPHERFARDGHDLRALVEDTVWHEVAHYFGLSEQEVLRAERRHEIERAQALRRLRKGYW